MKTFDFLKKSGKKNNFLLKLFILFGLCLSISSLAEPINQQIAANTIKESRQILQLAEYIAADYSTAVNQGKIKNADEYAEMQQFANIIVDKVRGLPISNSILTTSSLMLQKSVNSKETIGTIQQYSQEIRQQVLALSPALVLPKHLLAKAQTTRLFIENCSACHGKKGAGNGALAKTLTPEPTNFFDKERALNRSILGLYDAITNGLDGSAMRSFNNLNEKERWSLAFYVSGLAFNKPNEDKLQKVTPSINLQQWINNNPNSLMQQNALTTPSQIATWRTQPELFFTNDNSPITTTKVNLIAAVKAYKNHQLAEAQSLAVSAYLDGFELIENNLDAHDSALRKSIENQLLNFRNLLSIANQQPLINVKLKQLQTELATAEQLLKGGSLSNNAMFSAAMIILLREGLEALLVVLALITVLIRTKRNDALKFVHIGWVSALLAGGLTWWAAENLINISGASREVMEGGAALLAALTLFYVGYWMHSKTQASQWQNYINRNIDRHLTSGALWGITGLAFISVYREVFETVLFYQSLLTQAVITQNSNEQLSYLIAGLLSGVGVLALIAWLMIRYSVKLPLARFFSVSAYFMLLLAFILTGKGIAALQEAAIIGLSPFPFDFSISWLGISPTWQGLLTQAIIIVLSLVLLFKKNETI